MFTYIASHHRGATRFDCSNTAELILDIQTACGSLNGLDVAEAREVAQWAETAEAGDLLQWRQGWVLRRSANLPVEVSS